MATDFNVNRGFENPKTSRYFKYIGIVILIFILIYASYLIFNNSHNKLPGGIETNIPVDPKKDSPTVVVSNKTDLKNLNGKNEVNTVGGDNYGTNGGDHNSVTNNFGIKQRLLTTKELKKITNFMKDTAVNITLAVVAGDAESENYANNIIKGLTKKGFTKTHIQFDRSLQGGYDTLRLNIGDDRVYGSIVVFPAKNVKQ